MQVQPLETLFQIALNLDLNSLLKLCQSNKYLYDVICNNENFWQSKFKQDFVKLSSVQSWQQLYLNHNQIILWGQLNPESAVLSNPLNLGLRALQIALGGRHLLALDSAHFIYSLGENNVGQLGRFGANHNFEQLATTTFPYLSNDQPLQGKEIAAATFSSYAADQNYLVWAWGNNTNLNLGLGTGGSRIVKLPSTNATFKAQRIAAGHNHVLYLDLQQNVFGAGNNAHGQLGNYEPTISSPMPMGLQAQYIAAGLYTSAAIDLENRLWLWGDNQYGQLGNSSNIYAKQISLGGYHSLLIDLNNQVWVTGLNQQGQLGLGHLENVHIWTPLQMQARYVSAGRYHSALIDLDWNVWIWGDNSKAQLGLGYVGGSVNVPVQLSLKAQQVEAGLYATAMISLGERYNPELIYVPTAPLEDYV